MMAHTFRGTTWRSMLGLEGPRESSPATDRSVARERQYHRLARPAVVRCPAAGCWHRSSGSPSLGCQVGGGFRAASPLETNYLEKVSAL